LATQRPKKRCALARGKCTWKKFFSSQEVEILPFTMEAAGRYSMIRAEMHVSQADAIHLATAAAGVDLFFTNDDDFQKLVISGIRFFADLDGKVI
jgi:predicted nucleic acid-binding protein